MRPAHLLFVAWVLPAIAASLLASNASAATDDQNLTGLVYLADGTPLSATPWASNTSFAVYVNHGGSWSTASRYPATGWYLTSGGAYSIVLPAAQQNATWANGDPYRLEFDVSAITGVPGRTDNASSAGTGDAGKITPYGATQNAIAWNATDNWQRWDVVVLARPDLAVADADVVISPAPPFPVGTIVTIDATVRNLGQRDTADVVVRFTDGTPPGIPIGADATIPSLPVNGSAPVQRTWTASSPGTHRLCVAADPDNRIGESNEANNVGCASVLVGSGPVTRPDYVPWDPLPASPVRAGLSRPVAFSTQVENQGNATANATATLAFFNATTPASPFATYAVPPLAPSEASARFTAVWTSPATPGSYDVVADVDYGNALAEWNETNNRYAWTVTVLFERPVTNLVVGTPNVTAAQTYVTSATSLSFTVLDQSGTGIRSTLYRVDNGTWVNYTASGPFTLPIEGAHLVEWFSTDFAGNVEPVANATLLVDDTPPATTVTVGSPRYAAGSRLYVTSATRVALASADGGVTPVGLASLEYRLGGASWAAYGTPFTVAGADGPYAIAWRAADRLGNAANGTRNVTLDDTPPATTIAPAAGPYATDTAFTLAATDAGSGVNVTTYRIDGGAWSPYVSGFTVPVGAHVIGYRSADHVENAEAERTLAVTIVGPPPAPEANWKPLVAAVFAAVLALVGAWSADRAPWPAGKRRRTRAFLFASLPFVAVEAATGVVSLLTGLLAIPPLVGAGTAVDVAILVAGMVVSVYRVGKWKPPE